MFRRLLTFLALLTGLTALATPASASVTEAMSCEISASVHQGEAGSEQQDECPGQSARRSAGRSGKASLPHRRQRRINRPPVLFGVDRAYE